MNLTRFSAISLIALAFLAPSWAAAETTAQATAGLRSSSLADVQQDSLSASHRIIYIDGRPSSIGQAHLDSVQHLINEFYYDQFRHL